MASEPAANTRPTEVLAPILGTHLVGVFHTHLRLVAENLEKKRGQPPKTSLAAAKVLYQRLGDRAVVAADQSALDTEIEAVTGIENGAVGLPVPASGDSAGDTLDLDDLSELGIAQHIDELEHWLSNGLWLSPPYDLPPLLVLIEDSVAADERTVGYRGPESVVALLDSYRTMVDWAEAFVLQRPDDQADRDEVVLLTAARLNILSGPQTAEVPLQAEAILNRPYERLDAGWGDDTAVGVTTFSKGHFGNDQAVFNDVCRSFVVDLLHRATGQKRPRTIYLSTTIFDQSTGAVRAELDQKIVDCLATGWRVIHVLNRGRDESLSARARVQADFATHLLAHMQTKGVYVPVRSVPPDCTDMVLVDGVGAVVFPSIGYGTESPRAVTPPSPALAVRCITGRGGSGDGPAATPIVAELRAEARAIFVDADDTDDAYLDRRDLPFGYRLPTDNLLWFDRHLAASELLEGERYVMKAGVTTSTMPDHLSAAQFDAWRRQLELLAAGEPDPDGLVRGWPPELVDRARDHVIERGFETVIGALRRLRHKRSVRHFSFETNTMGYRYRDCVTTSELERYLSDERLWYSTNPAYGGGGLTLDQRHQHGLYLAQQLENTRVNLELGDRTGYNLGLLGPDKSQPYDISRTWWLATESRDSRADQVHFLHQPRRSSTAYVATLKADSLARFDAVKTFVSLFDAVWYTIEIKDRLPWTVADFILELLPPAVRREFARDDRIGLAR